MKQVLIVGAGHHFPKGAFAFLQTMTENERVHVKGLFFRPVDYNALAAAGAATNMIPFLVLDDNEKERIAGHKAYFARQCEQYHLPYTLHDNDGEWDKSLLIKESRFADLILISGEHFYAETDNNQPNEYLRETLRHAECPVLVLPENFTGIQHLFMAYDGSRESIYAIKQFCYLFPDLTDLPTEIVYIHKDAGHPIPDMENLQQFSRLKFDSMSFARLNFDAAEYFSTWIKEKKNVLLVSGSFGRSSLSYMVRRSFSEEIIHHHQLPVFIAHL
ncbi:MAG TPA: universal stress protein [Puia sp.]|nr:universal stress protein [Puia sp.]